MPSTMRRPRAYAARWWCAGAMVWAWLAAGCGSGGGGGGGGTVTVRRPVPEPSGGQWASIALSAGDVPAVPGPPPASLATELQELLQYQARRTSTDLALVAEWDGRGVVRWNEAARELVSRFRTSPPAAARDYAMLSVAQYDALVACWRAKYLYRRPAPYSPALHPVAATSEPSYPSADAVLAAVSSKVLSYCYPAAAAELAALAAAASESRLWAGACYRSDLAAGEALGEAVAERLIAFCRTDGADVQLGRAARADGYWPGVNPLLPDWSRVRPWLLQAADQFRPPPPPAFGSEAFLAALAEVRQISDTRTPEQLRIAQFWADGAGTATPPGHWNQIACDLLERDGVGELRAARALALLNMAVADAGISCWDAKYTYWLIRPSQADPLITTPPGLPNFPSYTSGHSTFSGAAAEVLGYLFPADAVDLTAQAHEASLSRLYGGIHYRFDCDAGVAAGEAIGRLAIARGQADGSP